MPPPRLDPWVSCRSLAVRLRPRQQPQRPRLAVAFARSFSDDASRPPAPPPSGDSARVPSPFNLAPRAPAAGGEEKDAAAPRPPDEAEAVDRPDPDALRADRMARGLDPYDPAEEGHRFPIPATPWRKSQQLQDRYDPVLAQLTRLIMRDGKLSKAQRDMTMILEYLRTVPPPTPHPQRPLLPGGPPPSHLPLDPVRYLALAVDSVAPLVRIARHAGILGGGQLMDVPMPLRQRQRRRVAFQWILDAVERRPSRGSGRRQFPHRIAEEVVAVAEGRSAVWARRLEVHKTATTARANLSNRSLKL